MGKTPKNNKSKAVAHRKTKHRYTECQFHAQFVRETDELGAEALYIEQTKIFGKLTEVGVDKQNQWWLVNLPMQLFTKDSEVPYTFDHSGGHWRELDSDYNPIVTEEEVQPMIK